MEQERHPKLALKSYVHEKKVHGDQKEYGWVG